MTTHPRLEPKPARIRTAVLARPAIAAAALWLLLPLSSSPAVALDAKSFGQQLLSQAAAQDVAQNLGKKALEANELAFLKNSGQITPQEYQARFQSNRAEIARLQQLVVQFPRDQQAAIRKQAETIFNQGMVELKQRAAQWQAQEQQKQQAARAAQIQAQRQQQLEAQKAQAAARQQLLDARRQQEAARQAQLQAQRQQQLEAQQKLQREAQQKQLEAQQKLAEARQQALAQQAAAQQAAAAQATAQAGAQQTTAQQAAAEQAATAQAGMARTAAQQATAQPSAAAQTAVAQNAAAQTAAARQAAAGLPPPPPGSALLPPPPPVRSSNASRAAPGTELPPPPPGTSIAPATTSAAGVPRYVWLLLLISVGGAVYFFFIRRRKKTARALPDVVSFASPAPALSEAPRTIAVAATSAAAVSAANVVVDSKVSQAPAGTSPVGSPPRKGSVKERLLAEQSAKYQATINAAMDELTATQMQMQERAEIPELLRKDLQRIGGQVYDTAKELMRARHGNAGKALLNALLLKPVWRLFRGGLIKKIVLGCALFWLLSNSAQMLARGAPLPLVVYALLVPVFYFLERRAQLKGPAKLMGDSANIIGRPVLIHFPSDQPPVNPQWAVRARGAPNEAAWDSAQLSVPNVDPTSVPGSFFLAFGDMATYRVSAGAAPQVISSGSGGLMRGYGDVLTDSLAKHNAELVPLIKHLEQFGELAWRERRQRAEIPRLEELLANVKRLEEIWRPAYTAEKVFEFLIRRIDLFNLRDKAVPCGLLLHGFPGNGKEFLARKVAQSVFAQFVKPNADQLASAKDVKELWAANLGKGPVVLFIEYADHHFTKPGSENAGSGSREATLAWLEEWARNEASQTGVWVVMTAQSEQNLHPRILSMLGSSKVEVTAPDAGGRELVLQAACTENQLGAKAPRWLIETSGGSSVRELRDIVRETKVNCLPDPPTDEHWRAAMLTVRGADAAFRDERKTWDRLVLPGDIKQQLQQAARILRDSERYKGKADIPNILLYGPPGTGKTDIARTIANESGVKFIEGKTADLKAQYIGQSAHLVRDLFSRARAAAPCVLFLDEIESVAPKRGTGDAFTADIVTQMLTEMEGASKAERPVIVLAATNLPEQIDDAIKRRFTFKIEIPLPDEAGRRELLKRFIAERPVDPTLDIEEVSAFLAKRLNRNSGSALSDIVKRAMQRAVAESQSPEDVLLTRDHLMKEAIPQGKEVSEADLAKIWEKIVLKPEVKSEILDKIRMFNRADKAAPKGLLLYGPPGTGKTEIARRIADSASCFFMSLKGPDLKAGYVGQSGERVQKIWEQARSRGRCVIFIDECEGVFARRGGSNSDSASEELVQAFLAEWDGVGTEDQRVWVVGATNRKDILDEAMTSRFGAEVEIGLPEAAQRMQILKLEMEKLERPAQIPDFVGATSTGLSGRNLSRLAADVCTMASKQGGTITDDLWRQALKRHTKSGSEAVDPNARWDTLILAKETLEALKGVCESLQHSEALRKQGFPLPKGALLYGPPGTGKTQIARTLANESGLPFLAASTADMKAGFIGQSGQKVRELFERARGRAPCILFIDEIDAVAPGRDGGGSDTYTTEIVNQLLQEMDGIKVNDRHVFVLAATNRPEAIDPAVRSRLKHTIEIPNPDREQREKLFRLFIGKHKTDFDADEMAAELARRTNNIGGRAISGIVEQALGEAASRAIAAGNTDNVVLTSADLMREVNPKGKQVSDADLTKIWEKIVLDPAVKSDILDKIRMFNSGDKAAPKGLLMYGPPGTGKTEIARRIADSASCFFLSLKGPDLKAGYIGQSGERVKKVWEQARGRGRCVIFIDECEGVFARRGGTNSDSNSEELVQAFLAEWDGLGTEAQQIWVVGATNRRDLLDDAIVSRFGAAVEIGLPGAPERLQIIRLEMAKLERAVDVPDFLGQATTGMSGRNLSRVASEVCTLATKNGGVITDDMWREVLKRHTKASSESVDEGARWDSLVLSADILDKLQTLCTSLRNTEEFKAQGFEVPKGALLYGPPGTGKTQIARTLANESGLPFIAATTADMKAGFVGQSGQKVRELFERARGRAPCILFIDEIEAVAAARAGPGSDSFTGEIVNQLLQEMDGVRKSERHVFVLAATNLPDSVDPAVLSRFEDRIEIGNPDPAQRHRLFRQFLGKLPAEFDHDAMASELATCTSEIGGREIRNVVQKAAQKAIRRAGGNPKNVRLMREDVMSSLPVSRQRPQAG